MIRLFVRHTVADFKTWYDGYKKFKDVQIQNGVKAEGVYQSLDDANDLTVWHDFKTLETAHAFVALPALKSKMEESGVIGPPTIWFVKKVG